MTYQLFCRKCHRPYEGTDLAEVEANVSAHEVNPDPQFGCPKFHEVKPPSLSEVVNEWKSNLTHMKLLTEGFTELQAARITVLEACINDLESVGLCMACPLNKGDS